MEASSVAALALPTLTAVLRGMQPPSTLLFLASAKIAAQPERGHGAHPLSTSCGEITALTAPLITVRHPYYACPTLLVPAALFETCLTSLSACVAVIVPTSFPCCHLKSLQHISSYYPFSPPRTLFSNTTWKIPVMQTAGSRRKLVLNRMGSLANIAPAILTAACRTIALNFMTELDGLFKLDGDLDTLDKTVHQKYATRYHVHHMC
jgi:hypothetical protein